MTIGTSVASVDLTDITYVADKLVGSGPGGDHVSPRTAANTTQPVGMIHHHKWWEILVAIDEDDYTALFNTDVEEGAGTGKAIVEAGDNTAIGKFVVTEVREDGKTRTITYEASKTYVANYSSKITVGEDKQPVEVKFICRGTRTVSAWA